MNLFDVSILGIVSFCLIRGIFRGLINEGVSLIGVIAGFCAAGYYFAWIVGLLSNWISNEVFLRLLGFFSIFLAIVIVFNVLIPAIKYVLGLEFIRAVDRSFGGGFGVTKGIIVSSTLLIIFTAFLPKGASIISDSQFSRYLTPFSEKLASVVRKEMKHEYFEKIENYKRDWRNHK